MDVGHSLVSLCKEHEELDQHCSQCSLAFPLRRLIYRVCFGIVEARLVRTVEK